MKDNTKTIYKQNRINARNTKKVQGNRNNKKRPVKKVSKWKSIVFFLVFEFIFCSITGPLLVLFGPFENVKRLVVGTFWATFRHQYVVKAFLSDEAVDRIVSSGFAKPSEGGGTIDKSLIHVDETHSDKIEVYSIESAFFKGKLMVIHDPTRVVLGYSLDMPYSGKTTSEIVRDFEGIAGINGGGFTDDYNYAGNGGTPSGYIIHDGEVIFNNLYDRDGKEKGDNYIGIDYEGKLFLGYKVQDPETGFYLDGKLSDVLRYNPKEALNFGPPLIINGQKQIQYGDGGWGIAPRTAIGQKKTGEILLLVLDGRSGRTIGATLKDAQDILYEYGAVNAANLDGGASTTMVYKNRIINIPSDAMGERSIPSAFVVLPPYVDGGGEDE